MSSRAPRHPPPLPPSLTFEDPAVTRPARPEEVAASFSTTSPPLSSSSCSSSTPQSGPSGNLSKAFQALSLEKPSTLASSSPHRNSSNDKQVEEEQQRMTPSSTSASSTSTSTTSRTSGCVSHGFCFGSGRLRSTRPVNSTTAMLQARCCYRRRVGGCL